MLRGEGILEWNSHRKLLQCLGNEMTQSLQIDRDLRNDMERNISTFTASEVLSHIASPLEGPKIQIKKSNGEDSVVRGP